MKILLIGGSGFIGQFTAAQLQQSGHSVTIFHRGKTSAPQGTEERIRDAQASFRNLSMAPAIRRAAQPLLDYLSAHGLLNPDEGAHA